MESVYLIKIFEEKELAETAAQWFAEKWGIPVGAYYGSMKECINNQNRIPRWYIALNHEGSIVAGAGIIENDFHDRKDLSPNLCALFVEEDYRRQGIARDILKLAREDLGSLGGDKLYLVTDHTEFYEKCGWDFFTTVIDDEGNPERMYVVNTL